MLDVNILAAYAKKYLKACMKHHPVCSISEGKAQPGRIIDVGIGAMPQDVVLTTLEDSEAQYVALSHCCKFKLLHLGLLT